ncbi:MAG: STAS domain-containing protein [Methanothrix sp.]|jgi:ABC-type transporter Mla MlaB component|nr:STAS domain-containing protein [Methanothrix sp.]
MLNVSFQKLQGKGILTFEGEITSEHNDDFRSALMISLSASKKVAVNFDKVSSFDRDCLHTFCATLAMAKKEKKEITYDIRSLWETVQENHTAWSMRCDVCHKGICPLARQKMAA